MLWRKEKKKEGRNIREYLSSWIFCESKWKKNWKRDGKYRWFCSNLYLKRREESDYLINLSIKDWNNGVLHSTTLGKLFHSSIQDFRRRIDKSLKQSNPIDFLINPRILERMAGTCPWKLKRDVSIRRCVVPIDGDKKAGRGCRFRGEKEEEDGKGGWRESEKEARHPFAGKMAEEKLASFSFIFERTPPHRPVWTLAGLSVVATHRRGWNGVYDCCRGVARFEASIFLSFFPSPL